MSPFDVLLSAVLTLVLHATALLGAVWLAERAGALRHPGWAEFAWRAALLVALLSTTVQVLRWLPDAPTGPGIAGTGSETAVGAGIAASARVPNDTTPRRPDASPPAAPLRGDVAAGAPASDALAVPDIAALGLLAAWLLALAVGMLRLGAQALAVSRLARHVRRHGTPPPAALRADVEHAAAVLDVAPPTLRLLDGIASPMLLPGRRLLLPAWVSTLSVQQRRALLAHELAHLQRRDPAWRVLQRVAALPLCFHPLAWHALARLDALAEDACDARAARLAGSGRPLAECLAACLTHSHARRAPVLAVAMADRPGPVVRRVRNLLEDSPMSDRPVTPILRRTAIVLGIIVAVALPGLAVTTFAAHAFGDSISSLTLGGSGDHLRYTTRDGDYALQMDIRGQVTFNDAESDVVRLGKGASLKLAETLDGVEREVRVFGKDGVIQRVYRRDGAVVPFDAEGRAWLARMLPTLMRESGIDAEGRSKRILAKGGTPALLAEIALIESDHARSKYLAVLFAEATLDDPQAARALALAAEIESDFELRQALQSAVGANGFPVARLPLVLDAAASIDSDFELAELLSSVAEEHALADTVLPAWKRALAGIGSDFEHRRVLDALLDRGRESPAAVVIALDSAQAIGSDFELRQVLQAAAAHVGDDAAASAAWFRAAKGIGSDFEQREALVELIGAGPVDVARADAVLEALADVQSDFEAGQVLQALAREMPDDAALRDRYRTQARRLGDHERGQAEKALDRFAAN